MRVTVSLESIWNLAKSLSDDNKKWLADRLYEEMGEQRQKPQLSPYTMEELNARIDAFEHELETGEYLTAREADEEVREAKLFPCQYTAEELELRLSQSVQSYRKGQYCTTDELRKRHPLCK